MSANIYIINLNDGRVLGVHYFEKADSSTVIDPKTGSETLLLEYAKALAKLKETKANIRGAEALKIFKYDVNTADKFHTLIPIIGGGERLGTLLMIRRDEEFDDEDLVLGEYGSGVVGLEIQRRNAIENEEKARKIANVQMAIATLSYSELEAVHKLFEELGGEEGLLVASKIADRSGITRSVIVNALRKLESAGVIESRSLGMKGTRIRVLNDMLLSELGNAEV